MKKIAGKTYFWIFLGFLVTILTTIPYFILGEASVITYHDQLDGEVINYILHAKYLFQGVKYYPELMNGIPANGIAVPAPGLILLYRILRPFTAFLCSLVFVKVIGYLSMFFLLKEFIDNKFLVFLCSVAFMLLPFYPVYGLCIPGQPLVWLLLVKIKKHRMKGYHLFMAAFYTVFSSLALVGYAVILVFFVYALANLIKKNIRQAIWTLYAIIIMVCLYAALNASLILQLLGLDAGFVSHKGEMVRNSSGMIDSLKLVLLWGTDYAKSKQIFMLPFLFFAVILYYLVKKKKKHTEKMTKDYRQLCISSGLLICIGVFYAIYHSELVVDWLNSGSGILHDFNFDRFTWMMPVIWFVVFALSLDIITKACSLASEEITKYLGDLVMFAGCGILCFAALWSGETKYNLKKLLQPDYYMMTWEQFYAEDLFDEIKQSIGRKPEDYRVVSLGIYSAAAAYNGFYCLDAYSNNYQLEYKHEFRKVIEKELAKSEYIRSYFDDWGNRCCILTEECGTYFNIEKRWNPGYHNLELDTKKLKELGCEYLFSGTWIINAEELGLELLRDTPYESEGSWYNIYVYRIL